MKSSTNKGRTMTSFKALITREDAGKFTTTLEQRDTADLPQNEVLVRVKYSSLNYKDALSSAGHKGITKEYPHTPGIDAAGIVEESSSDLYKKGDEVILMGYDLGMNTPGGLAEYIRVPAAWIIPLPKGLGLKEAMIYGTAGFTAALSVWRVLQNGITPESGKVAVSGATGGVGSLAVHFLHQKGFDVVAATGKKDQTDFLKEIGATEVISREDLDDQSGRPMLKGAYAAAIDTVGGNTLATLLKSVAYGGVVTACGLTHSTNFETTVFPFIIRGITFQGIDSVELPLEMKKKIWNFMASDLKVDKVELITKTLPLKDVPEVLEVMTQGKGIGRVVVDIEG